MAEAQTLKAGWLRRTFTPRRLCIAVIFLAAAAQLAVVCVEWWPFTAGLSQAIVWLMVLFALSVLLPVCLVLLFVAWLRRSELGDGWLLKLATVLVFALPLINLFFFFWFPTAERLVEGARDGRLAVVQRCLFWGIDPDATYTQVAGFGGRGASGTAIQAAATGGHLTIVEALLEAGAHIDGNNSDALRAAIHNRHPEVVHYLLSQGARFDGVLAEVLFYDVGERPRGRAALQVLVDQKPQIISSPWFLLEIAHSGDRDTARLLAEVDVADRFGPVYELYRSIVRGRAPQALSLFEQVDPELVAPVSDEERRQLLQTFTLDTNVKAHALSSVSREGLLYVASRFAMRSLAERLLAVGTPVDPPLDLEHQRLQSPLAAAIQFDHLAMVELLIDADADVARPNRVWGHPLFQSVTSSSLAIMEHLLDAGAPIDAPGSDINDFTPLMQAAQFDRLNHAQLLVARGADLSITRQGYFTACNTAHSEYAIAEYLAGLDCSGPEKPVHER